MAHARKRAQPQAAEKQARIAVRSDGGLRLSVIADTHGAPHRKTVELVGRSRPDAILHAGDIGDLAVLEPFRQLAPLYVVRGNIDARAVDLPDLMDILIESSAGQQMLHLLLLHIGVAGPKLRADVGRLAHQKRAQVVVCGHSHVPFIGSDRGVMVFNPGSVGPRRFHLPIVFGMLEISAGQLSAWHGDCESGERWSPPGTPSASRPA